MDTKCAFCIERRVGNAIISKIKEDYKVFGIRKEQKERKEGSLREPKVVVIKEQTQEKFTCPECKEDTLTYNEEEGLFICKCKNRFALIKVE